ncbi:hypothetical protein [Stappia sp. ICDLI1TA098]|jgi:hypothetical protein
MTFIHDDSALHTQHRIRDFAIAGVVALAAFAGMASIIHTVTTAPDQSVAVEAPKTDRLNSALPSACAGDSWGNWSPACVSAISGRETTRQVHFETFEARDGSARMSVLARVPSSS